jgi:hypothetical protein
VVTSSQISPAPSPLSSPSPLIANMTPAERYKTLSYDEFISIFSMPREDFEKLPEWKQSNIRKNKSLF